LKTDVKIDHSAGILKIRKEWKATEGIKRFSGEQNVPKVTSKKYKILLFLKILKHLKYQKLLVLKRSERKNAFFPV